ncbi:MAG: hypothetical protein JNJ57_16400 [Saprospiraceae bacterium]|nr:hypothetical protein [Saprospiraceae bacterium]
MKTFSVFGGACLVLFLSIFLLLPSQLTGRTDPPPSDSSLQSQPLGHLECTIIVDTNCVDQSLTLSAYLSYIFSGQLVPVVVDWSTGVTSHKIIVEPPGLWSWDESNFGCDHFTNSIELNAGFYDGQPEIMVLDGNCSNETVLTVNTQDYNAISFYQWNTGFTGTPYTVNQSGTYSVTVEDAFGCEASDTVAIQLGTSDEENCFGFCVDCSLDGLQGNNGVFPPSSGAIVCGQIALHNESWYGFVAGSESITFEVVTSNCQNGDGLQVALFDNCDDPDALTCNQGCLGCADIPLTLQYDAYVP